MSDKRLSVLIEAAFGFVALAGTIALLLAHQPEGAAVLAPIATFAIGHVMPGPSSGLPSSPADMPVIVSGPPDMAARITHVPRETPDLAEPTRAEMGAAIERYRSEPARLDADPDLIAPVIAAGTTGKRAPRRAGRDASGHDPHQA